MTYKDAGVDIDAGAELVRRIAKMAPGIGGFGGFFPLGKIPPPPFLFGCLAGEPSILSEIILATYGMAIRTTQSHCPT
jgi:hypothetical protein